MLDIAIPEVGCSERLTRTAIMSLEATLPPNSYRLHIRCGIVRELGSVDVGRKLDAIVRRLPDNAEWLFTMHNDAAMLSPGWYDWLQQKRRESGNPHMVAFLATNHGFPHPAGALYSVPWLRNTGATFMPDLTQRQADGFGLDTGEQIPLRLPLFTGWRSEPWMTKVYTVRDDTGRPLYAHLGGGTIGAGAWRPPVWWWRYRVHRHLAALKPDPMAYWWRPWWAA